MLHNKRLYYRLCCVVVKLGLSLSLSLREDKKLRVFKNKVLMLRLDGRSRLHNSSRLGSMRTPLHFDFMFTWCAAGGRLDVWLVYKMASRSMVHQIVVLLCGALAKNLRDYIVIKRRKSTLWVRPWILRLKIYGASDTLLKELSKEDPEAYRLHLRMSQSLFEELLDKVSLLIQAQNALRTSFQLSSRQLKPHMERLYVQSCLCASSAAQLHCGVVPKVELLPTLTVVAPVARLATLLCLHVRLQ